MTKEALTLAQEGVEIHSPNSPEYIVCAALIEALAQTEQDIPVMRKTSNSKHHELSKAQPEQEAVAWMRSEGIGSPIVTEELCQKHPEYRLFFTTPLYTTPPQRTWVELNDEQMWNAYTGGSDIINLDYAKSIIALFKEKNT